MHITEQMSLLLFCSLIISVFDVDGCFSLMCWEFPLCIQQYKLQLSKVLLQV